MTRQFSVAHLTAIETPPPELIEAAGEAGFDAVGLRLLRVTDDSPGYPLMDDPVMMKATLAAMRNTGVRVNDIEFIRITPETDPEAYLPMLDAGELLGARNVITAPYDDDFGRLADRLGLLTEIAAKRGMTAVLEFFPWAPVADLGTCRKVVEAADPRTGILVDALHFDRSGSKITDLSGIPSSRLPFFHLCDAPIQESYTTDELLFSARTHRLPPGEGEIELIRLIAALPADCAIGVEVPSASNAHPVELVARLRQLRKRSLQVLEASNMKNGLAEMN